MTYYHHHHYYTPDRSRAAVGGERFSTWSTADAVAGEWTLSDGNRTASRAAVAAFWRHVRGTTSRSSGKYYFEIRLNAADATSNWMLGLTNATAVADGYPGSTSYGLGIRLGDNFESGFTDVASVVFSFFAAAGVARFAVDFDAGKVWVGKNGSWLGSGDPSAGTNHAYTFTPATVGPLFPATGAATATVTTTLLSAANQFEQSIPTGFLPWG